MNGQMETPTTLEKPGANPKRPGIGEQLLGLLLLTHPIPSVMYVVAVGLFT